MLAQCFYKAFRYLLFKVRVKGARNVSSCGRQILVSNHAGSFGPISLITSLPFELYPWVDHEITDVRTASRRIQKEFLEAELHFKPPFSTYLGRVIARVCIALMKNINAIPVYGKSRRINTTVEQTLRLLERGKNILVFPENALKPVNEVLCDFCTGFLHVARLYYEKTREVVSFLPIAVNRKVKSIRVGKPIRFNADAPFPEEKARLKRELETTIYSLYYALENE